MSIGVKTTLLLLTAFILLVGSTTAFAAYGPRHVSLLNTRLVTEPNIRVRMEENSNDSSPIPKLIMVSGIDLKELEKLLTRSNDTNHRAQKRSSSGSDSADRNPPKNVTPKNRTRTDNSKRS